MNTQFLAAVVCAVALAPAAVSAATFYDEASFLAAAPGTAADDFEDSTFDGTTVGFDAGTITCSGGNFCNFFFGNSFGSPDQALSGINAPFFATPDTLTFTFNAAISAFGIFIGGMGDVGAQTLTATLSNGTVVDLFTNYVGAGGGFPGNTLFVGLTSGPFTSISFTGTANGDGVFFDDLRYGTVASVPLPASALLLGGALGGIGLMRRRRAAA